MRRAIREAPNVKLRVLCAALALWVSCGAVPAVHAAVRWGIVAGPEWSKTDPPGGYGFGGVAMRSRWAVSGLVGAAASIPIQHGLALEVEPQFLEQRDDARARVQVTSGSSTYVYGFELTGRLRAVALPVRAAWSPVRWLRLGAGPEARWLVQATETPNGLSVMPAALPGAAKAIAFAPAADIFEASPWTVDVTSRYRRFGAGVSGSLGVAWPMGAHEGRADLRWSEGLTDISRSNSTSVRPRGLQFVTSVLW